MQVDRVSMDLIHCISKGCELNFLLYDVDCFILANRADPDELLHMRHFFLVFTVCKSTCLPISRMERFN